MSADIYGFSGMGAGDFLEPFSVLFLLVYGIYAIVLLGGFVAIYVLQSIGLYSIAKRRGIHHPFLAWIPVGNAWVIGSISDQYQYVVNGRIRSRRKLLSWLLAGTYVLLAVFLVTACAAMIQEGLFTGENVNVAFAASMLGSWSVYMMAFALSVVSSVFLYIASYDLYASCNRKTAVLFLILSIFINVGMSIFIFINRNNDRGMPPRRVPAPVELPSPEPEREADA